MTEVVAVGSAEGAVLDVVFVHGLDGNARTSWSGKREDSFWPRWVVEDIPGVAVWSVGYDAASSKWLGHAMPIQDRAINVLAQLQNRGIGQRPLCFVTHSMGGLLVKEMLLHSAEGRAGYREFAAAVRGVAFLATPHTGSDLTKVVKALSVVYRATSAVEDLRHNSAHLRQLNDRYRDWVAEPGVDVAHRVFFETLPTKGVRVVDASSANPGLAGVRPIPVDDDHIGICKPADRESVVYGQVKLFVTGVRDSARAGTGSPAGEATAGGRRVIEGPVAGGGVTLTGTYVAGHDMWIDGAEGARGKPRP
ncbi:esterase/lipase family protein [Amycolatopsis sp. cg9]|uniref:esterase/lipase family protein n=1 Tax=Amycolatopsis sp. cg9 TaxID=3238801 RepID=UPI0035236891